MQTPSSNHAHQFSYPTTRPARILDNPSILGRSFELDESRTYPARFHFQPRGARARAKKVAKYSKYRNHTVWAHALVLFNVVGITFSQGVWLEYAFATSQDRGLVALAVVPALQIMCVLGMAVPVGWMYGWLGRGEGWRRALEGASVVAVCATLGLQWSERYVLTVVLQGAVLGMALGTLFTLSTLVLASHYRFNVPLVSMQGGFMGFLGAVVYTVVAREGGSGRNNFAPAATAGLMGITLLTANLLIRRVDQDIQQQLTTKLPKSMGKVWRGKGTPYFLLGYMLIFFGIFIFPIYIVLILPDPDAGFYTLISILGAAAVSSTISASPGFRRCLGPVDTYITAAILAGAISILPVWMPHMSLAIAGGAVYGMGLGAILALQIKVTTVFRAGKEVWHPDMPVHTAIVMALGGMSAFVGLLVAAVLMASLRKGGKVASAVAAGSLVAGGLLIAFARWKRCGRFHVAV